MWATWPIAAAEPALLPRHDGDLRPEAIERERSANAPDISPHPTWLSGFGLYAALTLIPFLYLLQKERLTYVDMTWGEWLWRQISHITRIV